MNTTTSEQGAGASTEVFDLTRAFIAEEETHLAGILAALRRVRTNLTGNDPVMMNAALREVMQVAASEMTQIVGHREEFRKAVGTRLGVQPGAVSLRLVGERLPPHEARTVQHGRLRLRELVSEVERVNYGNALVVWWCLEFVRNVFALIEGQPVRFRYSASGKAQRAASGPTWQAQG